jgi:hypothetical protein
MPRSRQLTLIVAAAVLVVVSALAAACGGTATGPASAAPSPATITASPTPTPVVVPRDLSSPAKALIGHWHDANDMDQYFDGKVWSTVTAGGQKWKYGYLVKSQDKAAQSVLLKTFAIKADGSTNSDVENIRFAFIDNTWDQLQWGKAGTTADYVDGQIRP